MHIHPLADGPAISAVVGWCGAPGSIPALLFFMGLVGGFAHCGPMCGPFVLAQLSHTRDAVPMLRRLSGGMLLPYHLGRLTTYCVLGAIAAGGGSVFSALTPLRFGLVLLLLGAAMFVLAQAVAQWGGQSARTSTLSVAALLGVRVARLAKPLLLQPGVRARFFLGLVLGLLPCGFLYTALAAATATQIPILGAAAMGAFGLGTLPSLLLVGCGGAVVAARWRVSAQRFVAPLLLFNAAMLTTMAITTALS
ncbi:MAG: sulfite exporter TauE/SafE family protein [Alphaproteobacteria bacterium]|nr:sulfite exporter TauE/SafE family protein [Alphaproteobacteria bacterium]